MRKIGIISTGQDLDSITSSGFGKSPYFCIVEWDNGQIANYTAMVNSGLGVGCGTIGAQQLANLGIEAMVTEFIGDNSHSELKASGIEVYGIKQPGKVRNIAMEYFNGNLQLLTPNAPCTPGGNKCNSQCQGQCGKGGCGKNKP